MGWGELAAFATIETSIGRRPTKARGLGLYLPAKHATGMTQTHKWAHCTLSERPGSLEVRAASEADRPVAQQALHGEGHGVGWFGTGGQGSFWGATTVLL